MVGPWLSRLTTYVASSTPSIKAADLVLMQDTLTRHEEILSYDAFHFEDDFLEGSTAASLAARWTYSASCIEDSAAGGFGAAQLNLAASSGPIDMAQKFAMPLANRKFRIMIRARIASGSGYDVYMGLNDHASVTHDFVGFLVSGGVWVVTQSFSGLPVAATGTSPAVDANYHTFEIRCDPDIAQTMAFYIDGVLVKSFTWTGSGMEATDNKWVVFHVQTGPGTGVDLRVDAIKIVAERS